MKPILLNKWVLVYLFLLTVVVIFNGFLITKLFNIFLFLISALILTFTISSYLLFMERKGIPDRYSVSILFIGTVAIIIALSIFIIPGIAGEVSNMAQLIPEEGLSAFFEQVEVDDQIGYKIPVIGIVLSQEKVTALRSSFLSFITEIGEVVIGFLLSSILIVPLLTIMLIKDKEKIKKGFFAIIPNKYFEVSMAMADEIIQAFRNFCVAKGVQMIVAFTTALILFFLIGLPLPLVMAFLVALFNIIPYIGPLLGALPPLAVAFLTNSTLFQLTIGSIILVQIMDNVVVQPFVLPRLVKEHPLVVLLVSLIGATFFGIPGLLLAQPVFSMLKVVYSRTYEGLRIVYFPDEQ